MNSGFPRAIARLAQASIDLGAQFYFNTRARQLVRGTDNVTGRVTSVIAEGADGTYARFNTTKGVILCTGCFGSNEEMRADLLYEITERMGANDALSCMLDANASGMRFGWQYFTSIAGQSLSIAQTLGMLAGQNAANA